MDTLLRYAKGQKYTTGMKNYRLEVERKTKGYFFETRSKYWFDVTNSSLRIVFDGQKRIGERTDESKCFLLLPEQQARILAESILTVLDNYSISIEKTTIDETKNEKI